MQFSVSRLRLFCWCCHSFHHRLPSSREFQSIKCFLSRVNEWSTVNQKKKVRKQQQQRIGDQTGRRRFDQTSHQILYLLYLEGNRWNNTT
mmetsp:Transcript_12855/g.26074  ORF Transcript_12855/g.26074 Transcript_12855/m.26074 type:complete len:90 (-) Transcript_12855:161-430(-)